MPALPPGREETAGQQSSGSRTIRVYNVDLEDVPPFGAMEIAGWDSDRRAFKVQRCTISGRNDLVFNGMTPIPSGMEGTARSDVQVTAAFKPSDGSNPLAGDVWGVAAGEWLLSPRYPGYTILDTTTAVRGFCVVVSQRANITEFIRVTGTPTPGPGVTIPTEWVQAELVVFDPSGNAWGTPSPQTPVYFRDLSGLAGYYDANGNPCIAHANRVGFMYGQPLYVGKAQCSTTTSTTSTTTTTTESPCTGRCKWLNDHITGLWSLSSSTCSTGCHCFAPGYCPPPQITDACTYTSCGHFPQDQTAPACNGTGTTTTTTPGPDCTTTTTTPGPDCTTGCTWFCHPVAGWQQVTNGCAGSCPCSFPSAPCAGDCSQTTTPCVPPPPPPPPFCRGGCNWIWVTPISDPASWYLRGSTCSSFGVPNCYCDQPSFNGSVCAQQASTPCYVHSDTSTTTTRSPCDSTPTTTTPGPGCSANCLWGTVDGVNWSVIRNCPGCLCSTPLYNPTDTCEQVETPCVATTTSTTTSTTTTTTASPCCSSLCSQYCSYTCGSDGSYVNTFAGCEGGCSCPSDACLKATFGNPCPTPGDGSHVYSFRCCLTGTTTTTTAGPTTTTTTTTTTTAGGGGTTTTTTAGGGGTTTTTTGGGGSWALYTGGPCGTPGQCSNAAVAGCTATGSYANCLSCKTSNPGATGPC